MKGVPAGRLFVYLALLFALPLFFAVSKVHSEWRRWIDGRYEMERIEQRLLSHQARGVRNQQVRERYLGADPIYLTRALEPYPLLGRELSALQKLVENEPSLPNKEVLQRYDFLRSGKNRLSFAESAVQSGGDVRETIESLKAPVEVDLQNLVDLLELIEGESLLQKPQLLVTEFRLDRKETTPGNEVFVVDLKLLKREYGR